MHVRIAAPPAGNRDLRRHLRYEGIRGRDRAPEIAKKSHSSLATGNSRLLWCLTTNHCRTTGSPDALRATSRPSPPSSAVTVCAEMSACRDRPKADTCNSVSFRGWKSCEGSRLRRRVFSSSCLQSAGRSATPSLALFTIVIAGIRQIGDDVGADIGIADAAIGFHVIARNDRLRVRDEPVERLCIPHDI